MRKHHLGASLDGFWLLNEPWAQWHHKTHYYDKFARHLAAMLLIVTINLLTGNSVSSSCLNSARSWAESCAWCLQSRKPWLPPSHVLECQVVPESCRLCAGKGLVVDSHTDELLAVLHHQRGQACRPGLRDFSPEHGWWLRKPGKLGWQKGCLFNVPQCSHTGPETCACGRLPATQARAATQGLH